MNTSSPWMIYGANGYTGKLCAEEACRRGMRPVLAGRSAEKIRPLAETLGLPHCIFNLNEFKNACKELDSMNVILNCAGPFSSTAVSCLNACVETHTHYLDITGEISVFEYVHQNHERWAQGEIVVLPGVGMDVVPTDCMAAMLKKALPEATHLRLAFKTRGGRLSPGTAKTIIESMGDKCVVRRKGELIHIPMGSLSALLSFTDKPSLSVAIAWGDVSTAFYSTSIPNIEVYFAMPPKQLRSLKISRPFAPAFKWNWVQRIMKRRVDKNVTGPDEKERAGSSTDFYGDVVDAEGRRMAMTMHTPNGYSFTYDAAVTAVEEVLSGKVAPGAHTPSTAFGGEFVARLKGVQYTCPEFVNPSQDSRKEIL